jgi:hypothetical protein
VRYTDLLTDSQLQKLESGDHILMPGKDIVDAKDLADIEDELYCPEAYPKGGGQLCCRRVGHAGHHVSFHEAICRSMSHPIRISAIWDQP